MSEQAYNSWEEFLNPDKLKMVLVQTAIYLTSYELFKSFTIDNIKDFFTSRWELNKETGILEGFPSKEYKTKVLDLYTKDEFHACCLWLRECNALDDDDMMDIALIRKHRNQIAHELPKFLGGQGKMVNVEKLSSLKNIQRKLETWWFKEIELPTTPDVDEAYLKNIDWEKSIGSNTLLLTILGSIFDGDDAYFKEIHSQFIKAWQNYKC